MLFPYKLRANQTEIINLFEKCLIERKHLILESGTGSGKTICALTPTLEFALKNNKKILYLTRTNSQQKQVINELRQILNKIRSEEIKIENNLKNKILGVALQGRHNLCPLTKEDKEFEESNSEELALMCSYRKRNTLKTFNGEEVFPICKYFANSQTSNILEYKNWVRENLPTSEELISYCVEREVCPFEVNKILLEDSIVITSPYIYFFDIYIRKNLLEWIGCNIENIILIVDEAHNLPNYARELLSSYLSVKGLNMGIKEAKEFSDAELINEVKISEFFEKIKEIILKIEKEYVFRDSNGEDGLVPSEELERELISSFRITSNRLIRAINDLLIHGELIKNIKIRRNKLPRSYIHSIAEFLGDWVRTKEEQYVKLVVSGEIPRLEIYCLDSSLITKEVKKCYCSFHFSGTLTPLEEYRDTIGLPEDTLMEAYFSPFPKENRKVFFVKDVTIKYEELEKNFKKLQSYTLKICNAFNKNTIVFFPSFSLLEKFLKNAKGKIKRNFYVEEKRMAQEDLMESVNEFKAKKNSIFLTVIGGRISEGLDFPAEELEIAILYGIPYPKPNARQKALLNYYDIKFGKGWEYTVNAPTLRKMLQSIGRLIRSENDRGVAVILDKRAIRFRKLEAEEVRDIVKKIKEFFDNYNTI